MLGCLARGEEEFEQEKKKIKKSKDRKREASDKAQPPFPFGFVFDDIRKLFGVDTADGKEVFHLSDRLQKTPEEEAKEDRKQGKGKPISQEQGGEARKEAIDKAEVRRKKEKPRA